MKKCPNCNAEYPDTQVFCADCGTKLNEVQVPSPQSTKKPKPVKASWFVWVLLGMIVCLICVLYQQMDEVSYYSRQANRYQELYEESKTEYEAAVDAAYFYTKYARILPADENGNYTEFYHIYGCPDCDTTSFWIYNIDTADKYANPCPLCCKND